MYTAAQLKDSVSGILSGLNLSNVTGLSGAIERAARTLVQKADIVEATGKQTVTLYDHVFDYAAPTTIFGGSVYDLRPQGLDRNDWDYVYKQYIEQFDRTKMTLPNGVQLTFEYSKGVGIMRVVSARVTSRAVLDPMTDDDGWVAAGSAGAISVDETDFYEDGSSLRFTLTGASTGTLTKTISAGDMSTYQGVGVVFLAIKTPSAANLTSVAVRLGSSSTAYTAVSDTDGFLGAWVADEWLIVALDLATGTDTGTPDYTNIDYLQVRITHAATLTNFRVGGIWASLPSPYTLIFGSAAIFMASGSNPAATITSDSDQILLNDAAYTLLQWECAKEIAMQQGGTLASGLVQMIQQRLDVELYPQYRADNPSQELRTIDNWYGD